MILACENNLFLVAGRIACICLELFAGRNEAPGGPDLKVGLFYADEYVCIANRIIKALSRNGCKTAKCDFKEAGLPKMDVVESFICQQRLVIWLATRASLNDEGISLNTQALKGGILEYDLSLFNQKNF